MKHEVLAGQLDYTVLILIRDDAGAPATGLTEADVDIAYARVETDNDVTTNDVTPAALAALTTAHTDWGLEEVSATDHPGLYRLDIGDAVFATGAWSAVVSVTGTGLDPCQIEFIMVPHTPLTGVLLAPTTHTSAVIPTVTTTGTATAVTTVNGLAAGVITAASIATGAIDADAIADGAIDAGAIAADAITAAKIADGAIDAATFAAGAITATVIATGAIDADALAADAGTELGTAVWATAARTLTAATNITSTGGTTYPQTGDSYGVVSDPAFGNAALKTIADNIPTNAELATAITAGVAGTPAAVLAAATAAPIAANIEQINTVPLTGDGSGTPFNV